MTPNKPELFSMVIHWHHTDEMIKTLSTSTSYAQQPIEMVVPRWLNRNQKIIASDGKMNRFLQKIQHAAAEPSVPLPPVL